MRECVSSRIRGISFRFSRVKVCVVLGHHHNEDGKGRHTFLNDLDRIMNREGNGYRLCAKRPERMDWRLGDGGYNWCFLEL